MRGIYMFATYLFMIILAVAAGACLAYSGSIGQLIKTGSKPGRTKSGSNSGVRKPDGHLLPHINSVLKPSDEGVHHNSAVLSAESWADLQQTLMAMSRLPKETSELIDILNDPEAFDSDIPILCMRNIELSGKIISLLNSPFYSLDFDVHDLRSAVTLLGFSPVRRAILAASLFIEDSGRNDPIDRDDLWKHSMATGRLAMWLAERSVIGTRHTLLGAGSILHDVGKLVLQEWRPEGFKKAMLIARKQRIPLIEAELAELGVSHAIAGSWLLERWGFPSILCAYVRETHSKAFREEFPEPSITNLAGRIARYLAIGFDGEPSSDILPEDLCRRFMIDESDIPTLIGEELRLIIEESLSDIRAACAV